MIFVCPVNLAGCPTDVCIPHRFQHWPSRASARQAMATSDPPS